MKREPPRLPTLNWVYCVTEVSGQTCEEMVSQSLFSEGQITGEGEWILQLLLIWESNKEEEICKSLF